MIQFTKDGITLLDNRGQSNASKKARKPRGPRKVKAMTHYYRNVPVDIVVRSVGQSFGTVAIATVYGHTFESSVRPYGFEVAAIDDVRSKVVAFLASR